MKPTLFLICGLLFACGGPPKSYHEACESDAECSGELSCETLVDIYYSMYDTGENRLTWEACSMACETDADCPDSDPSCDGPDTCLDGICNPPNCV